MSTQPTPDAETAAPHHPCVLGALVQDVGVYLLGSDVPEPARRMAAQLAFRHARTDFEAFADSSCAATDVVTVELSIRGAGMSRHSVYTHSPGPLALLLVAARNCRPGDLVELKQVTAKCGHVVQSARWPFGMAEAETMTRPATGLFVDFADRGAQEIRVATRDLGRFGRITSERERRDSVCRLPRAWIERLDSGRARWVARLRWRHTTLRLGWSRRRVP